MTPTSSSLTVLYVPHVRFNEPVLHHRLSGVQCGDRARSERAERSHGQAAVRPRQAGEGNRGLRSHQRAATGNQPYYALFDSRTSNI